MRKIFNAAVVAAILIFASSCIKEKQLDGGIAGKTDNAEVILRLKTPGGFSSPQSRSLTNAQENTIDNIYVLVFDKTNTLVAIKQGEEVDYTVGSSDPRYSGTGSFSVTLAPSRTPLDTYNLVVLANAETILTNTIGLNLSAIGDKSYSGVTSAISAQITGAMYPAGGTIPMWGESGPLVIEPGGANQNLTLTRSVARIDVGVGRVSYDGTSEYSWDGKDVGGTAIPFALTEVYVIRSNDKYAVIPNTALAAGVPTIPTGTTAFTLAASESAFAFTAAGGFTSRDIYVPEADILIGTGGEPGDVNHEERMAVVVGGSYDGGVTTYYRLDFAKNGGLMNVLRNHLYQFNISGVSGTGYPDVETAYKSLAMNMTVDILEWNETEMGDIIFDGQYFMSIKPVDLALNFYKDADRKEVAIKTDVPSGWKIVKITELSSDGITENDISSGGWLTTGVSQGASSAAYVPFDVFVTENPSSTDQRIGYVYIEAGRLRVRISVIQGIIPKKAPIFNFVEYENLMNPGQTVIPIGGGEIATTVETNIGWTLKTDLPGISASYSEPESYTANNISLSITIPGISTWTSSPINVWIESEYYYPGQKLYLATFTQTAYSLNYVSTTCPDAVPPAGGAYDMVFTGECPDFKVRLIDSGNTTLWESSLGSVGARQISIPSFASATDRTLSIQYDKNGTWITAKTVTQKGQVIMSVATPKNFYILNGYQHTISITSNVGWRVEVTEDSSGIISSLTNSIGENNGSFGFSMVDDMQSMNINSGIARLTVYPEVPGMFTPIELMIQGLLYFDTGDGLYFWVEDFTNSSWFNYANVQEGDYTGGFTSPWGQQVTPPRAGSCANLDPANPLRWRLPSRGEMEIVGTYASTNGGASEFGFAVGIYYWGSRSFNGATATHADYSGRWTAETTWVRQADGGDHKTATQHRARCIATAF